MDWLNGFEVLAMTAPWAVVAVVALLVCVILVTLIAAAAGMPIPWRNRRRNQDFVDTVPVTWNPVQRPLRSAQVPPRSVIAGRPAPLAPPMPPAPAIRNMGNVPIYVQTDGRTRVIPPEDKDCCGACDGTKCGDKPAPSAPVSWPAQVHRSLSATPGVSPTSPLPTPRRD